ncbi:MAG: histidinol-phosphate transaminase [Pseudomonadota bacterium]
MTAPVPNPGILDIAPYVPGDSHISGAAAPKKLIKLSSNETPLGPSPAAIEAYLAAAQSLERYPDGQAVQLRAAIADVLGLDAKRIICGAGSDEVLTMLAQAYLQPGDEAIHTTHGFLVYPIAIKSRGATAVIAPETNLTADVDAILSCVTPRTRMVFLANPNNPTGTMLPTTEIDRLRAGLRPGIILVLDGAYAEYVDDEAHTHARDMVEQRDDTVMTRTFSKIHGLAALRLGWGYGPPDMIAVLNRIRGPFNVSAPALAAGTAAIKDVSHWQAARQHNDTELAWLPTAFEQLGIGVTPSAANFLLLHVGGRDGQRAEALDVFLKQRRILLRKVGAYGLPDALRMSIGTRAENEAVVAAIADFIGKTDNTQNEARDTQSALAGQAAE